MRSKYSAVRTVVDNISFASKREAKRYGQLKMLQMAGEISELRLQVSYDLNPGGAFKYTYRADFVYKDKQGNEIVEDVKGYRTKEYVRKRSLMLKIHGIKIKET